MITEGTNEAAQAAPTAVGQEFFARYPGPFIWADVDGETVVLDCSCGSDDLHSVASFSWRTMKAKQARRVAQSLAEMFNRFAGHHVAAQDQTTERTHD